MRKSSGSCISKLSYNYKRARYRWFNESMSGRYPSDYHRIGAGVRWGAGGVRVRCDLMGTCLVLWYHEPLGFSLPICLSANLFLVISAHFPVLFASEVDADDSGMLFSQS